MLLSCKLLTSLTINLGVLVFLKIKRTVSFVVLTSMFSNVALAQNISGWQRGESVKYNNSESIQTVFDDYQYAMDGWDGQNDLYKDDADIRLATGLNDLVA